MIRKKESEKLIERTLVNAVQQAGGLCIKLLTHLFIGLPDRLVLLPGGKLFFVELKTTGLKPRKIQEVVHNKLRALGFYVLVIDSTAIAKSIVDETSKYPSLNFINWMREQVVRITEDSSITSAAYRQGLIDAYNKIISISEYSLTK